MLIFDEILLHIKFQLKLFHLLFKLQCEKRNYSKRYMVKSSLMSEDVDGKAIYVENKRNASESFQLCAISINDTVNIHVLLSVKLSMFHSPNRFFFLTEIAHISSLNFLPAHILPHIEQWVWKKAFNKSEWTGYIDKWFLAFYPFQCICNNWIFTSSSPNPSNSITTYLYIGYAIQLCMPVPLFFQAPSTIKSRLDTARYE